MFLVAGITGGYEKVSVYFNGVKQYNCVAADDKLGIAFLMAEDQLGKVMVDISGEPVYYMRKGEVVFEFEPGFEWIRETYEQAEKQ